MADHTPRRLNRAEVLALQPGPATDNAVAVHLMGLELFYGRHGHAHVKGDYGLMGNNLPPSYSTDIRAAWTVVEKLMQQGMVGILAAPHTKKFRCQVYAGKIVVVYGDTAPVAICRAALLTLCEETL